MELINFFQTCASHCPYYFFFLLICDFADRRVARGVGRTEHVYACGERREVGLAVAGRDECAGEGVDLVARYGVVGRRGLYARCGDLGDGIVGLELCVAEFVIDPQRRAVLQDRAEVHAVGGVERLKLAAVDADALERYVVRITVDDMDFARILVDRQLEHLADRDAGRDGLGIVFAGQRRHIIAGRRVDVPCGLLAVVVEFVGVGEDEWAHRRVACDLEEILEIPETLLAACGLEIDARQMVALGIKQTG